MAQIMSEGPVGDGYDVRVLLDDGTAEVFHFQQQPANTTTAIAAIIQAREDARLVFVIQGEEA